MPSLDTAEAMLARWPEAAGPLRRIGAGHINDTWQSDRHVLQRLNGRVFAEPRAVLRNLTRAVDHERSVRRQRLLVPPLPARDGETFAADGEGGVWRLFARVPGRSFERLPDALLGAAGRAFGALLECFRTMDGGALEPAIDGFHDLPRYLTRFDGLPAGAVAAEAAEIDRLRDAFPRPRVERVIHGDCKVNNLLFQGDADEVAAIVDLDTIMVGDPAWDFGDLVRSVCAGGETVAEASFSEGRFERVAAGFVRGFGAALDVPRFAAAPAYMSFMLGVRFLTDHLEGDRYFRVARRGDNLERARSQLTLAARLNREREAMARTLSRLAP